MPRNTIARIDTAALTHNLARVRELAPNSRIMAVVKADPTDIAWICACRHSRMRICWPWQPWKRARAIRRLGSRLPVLLLEGVLHAADLPVAAELALELTIHHPRPGPDAGGFRALHPHPGSGSRLTRACIAWV